MHVLVIGGTRFVGYLLVWRLLAEGHRVTTFHRGTTPDPFGDRVERLIGDRTTGDFARLLADRRFDAAVDFAAYEGRDVRVAVEVLDVGHYVFISSGQVYLVREGAPSPARETDYQGTVIPCPDDPFDRSEWEYGVFKRDCEDVLADAWATRHFPATRLRIPMVNGERDHYRRTDAYLFRMLDGGPIVVPDGGGHTTRHVYGADVVAQIVAMLGNPRTLGEAFNLAQHETPTLFEFLTMLAEHVGARAPLVSISSEKIRKASLDPRLLSPYSARWMSFIDPTRAETTLGFRATPVREYLGRIVASFLAHPPATAPDGYSARAAEIALASSAG